MNSRLLAKLACAGLYFVLLASCSEGDATAASDSSDAESSTTSSSSPVPKGGSSEANADVSPEAQADMDGTKEGDSSSEKTSAEIKDASIAEFQIRLLDIAIDAASAMPLMPHLKNRSRAQEKVVRACLDLGLPRRALEYNERIENWRKGLGYAEFAYHCAQIGATTGIDHYLQQAEREANHPDVGQAWRRDKILAAVAKVHAFLGNDSKANQLDAGVEDRVGGQVNDVRALKLDDDQFENMLDYLSTVIKGGNFDQVKNALSTYATLYERFFQDEVKRVRILDDLRLGYQKLPHTIRIDTLLRIAETALHFDRNDIASGHVETARGFLEAATWAPEDQVPLTARIARMRYRIGETERAMQEIEESLAIFKEGRERIVDIYRADALRPVAETFFVMGQTDRALEIFMSVVEEGVHNPNSRPRAEDLVATCCSMAKFAVEPTEDLMIRILEVRETLGSPW